MNADGRKIPEHEAIYLRVRDAILFGELVPGQAVTIQGLAQSIGAGMTPIREAIRRLTSDGALKALGNRRIVVPSLTLSEADELGFARGAIEPKLAEIAAQNADRALISRLQEIDFELDQAIETGSIEGYLINNYRFHFTLYQAADADILCDLAHSLWLRTGPSSRVVCGRFGTANLPDMHDSAMQALRDGQPQKVAAAVAEDISQGIEQIRRAIGTDELA